MRLLFKLSATILILLVLFLWYQYQQFKTTAIIITPDNELYLVEPGSHLQHISQQLSERGISPFPSYYLTLYGRLTNTAHKIKAGQYKLNKNSALPELLNQFIEGKVVQHPFTIIEGMTAQELINAVATDNRIEHSLASTKLKDVMVAIGSPDKHGEGEFLPETYYFPNGTRDIELLERAHRSMQQALEEAWKNRDDGLPYENAYQALIMASIIEKETGIAKERAEISGVFVRRLQKGMRLQTDPTVIYGIENYNGNIRKQDLRTDTPYNTYTRYGLPPTPIALPSKAAILAALHPKPGKSLYFVATGKDGRHHFSETLAEHNQAVRKYQLKK